MQLKKKKEEKKSKSLYSGFEDSSGNKHHVTEIN